MQSIRENTKLRNMISIMFFMATLLIFNSIPELQEFLELTPFPNEDF